MQRWRQLRSIKRRPVTNKYGLDDKRFLRIARSVLAFVTPRRRCVSFNRSSFLREITILISRWTLDESTGRVRVAHRQDVGSYFKRTHFLRTATHETDWFHTSSFFLRAAFVHGLAIGYASKFPCLWTDALSNSRDLELAYYLNCSKSFVKIKVRSKRNKDLFKF